MPGRNDTAALRILRTLFYGLFFVLIWGKFGWGFAIAALLIFTATGVQGERRSVFVPVSGVVRIVIELAYIAAGVTIAFLVLGILWGAVIAAIELVLVILSMKRFRHLSTLRR